MDRLHPAPKGKVIKDKIIVPLRFLIPLLLLAGMACNNEGDQASGTERVETKAENKFDRAKWRIKEGADYPFREQMLDDVLYNDTIRTLDREEILDLLGEPDRTNEEYLYYRISQKRVVLWPIHTITLVIKLTHDNGVEWIKVHE